MGGKGEIKNKPQDRRMVRTALLIVPVIGVLLGAIATTAYAQNQTCDAVCVGFHARPIQGGQNNTSQNAPNQDYLRGYSDGSGNATAFDIQHNTAQPFIGKDFGDFSDLSNIPLIGGMIASHSVPTGILHNEQGVFIPWTMICNKGQGFILQSCNTLVNSDGSLTHAGETAVGCIRNGLVVAVLANQHNISLDLAKSVLNFAAPLTGCGGIVNLDTIQNEPQFKTILDAITPH